jgi:Protein of unknown function (DUF3500)
MRTSFSRTTSAFAALILAASLHGAAQGGATVAPADATARIVSAANAVLASLDPAGKAKLQYRFDDAAQKVRWSNFPSPMFQRVGLRLGDLTPAQRGGVTTLLQAALSADGYRKVTEIMRGDEVLRTTDGGRGPRGGGPPGGGPPGGGPPAGGPPQGGGRGGRGPGGGGGVTFGQDEYYLAFLGAPSTTAPWMLQFGGHHLAINLTLGGAQASMTPSLPAAQPATYTFEGKEIRPLGKENDKGFALINALEPDKRSQAILNYRVSDLVLGPGQDGTIIQPEGIRASALSQAQQTMLLEIVREWAGIMNDSFAEPRMAEIRRNLPQTYFAWSGPTTNGSVIYYRIQGPTLVIEYAPQGSVDHIHTIYRDPTNDYGAKFAGK